MQGQLRFLASGSLERRGTSSAGNTSGLRDYTWNLRYRTLRETDNLCRTDKLPVPSIHFYLRGTDNLAVTFGHRTTDKPCDTIASAVTYVIPRGRHLYGWGPGTRLRRTRVVTGHIISSGNERPSPPFREKQIRMRGKGFHNKNSRIYAVSYPGPHVRPPERGSCDGSGCARNSGNTIYFQSQEIEF